MATYVVKPAAPNQDKRWKFVDATMRRMGQQSRSLIETLHTVQEAFGYLDEQALRYVAGSLRVPLSRAYGVQLFITTSHSSRQVNTHVRSAPGHPAISKGQGSC
jgi:bidirectional [NiFe] hydrogenase diaphorase subunit